MPPSEAMPRARALAERALRSIPISGTPTRPLATSRVSTWNWSAAERDLKRAVELYPGSANAHQYYGYWLLVQGHFDASRREFQTAHNLDPLSDYVALSTLWPLYNGRRYDDTIREATRLTRASPGSAPPYLLLGQALLKRGNAPRAIEALEQAVKLSGGVPLFRAWLGFAYAAGGRRADAQTILETLRREAQTGFVPAYAVAVVYVGLGERDSAFVWLDRSVNDRSEDLTFVKVDPGLDVLRQDRRYGELVRRVGLTP